MSQRSSAGRLDARDLKILALVQTNGRISTQALAKAIGLSLAPCFKRLKRLERDGFIRSYRGVIDAQRCGSFVVAHTEVTLARHRAVDFSRFEAAVCRRPEIVECDAVSGGIDYVLKVITRDLNHYQQLIHGLLDEDLGVDTYFTYIATKSVKRDGVLPIELLMQGES
ncbi:Lrp/AsnC family transcriptional regulator [Steroidobacter sp.]|uniref:Lrp/AsnC family transcriptional regulator n=1 Tax=Steroidobacter sp. TaxID=1978227 RepID=UPI001A4BCE17|nr:Lrp/AsnC family transcriptional regulator [Steroidobacter sp.]MBL8270525.1 Lrp/AsnC family transcriptional regulator [Steroidobacter sp.]